MWLRKFREYTRARAIVRTAMGSDVARRTALASLASHPGYLLLKMALIEAAMNDVAAGQERGRTAPGLSLALGVMARCEQLAAEEVARMSAKTEDET